VDFVAVPNGRHAILPPGALPLLSSLSLRLAAGLPFLSEELAQSLNPTAVTVLRADGLPAAYSGTPFKAPYVELAERCAPVQVVIYIYIYIRIWIYIYTCISICVYIYIYI